MPKSLAELFDAASTALFNLHLAMKSQLRSRRGCDLWREIYRMRVEINQRWRPMTENNFKTTSNDAARKGEPDA